MAVCLFDEGLQTAYLFAWLMMLRIDEVVSLRFDDLNVIPGESE
jgi:hypothetical protein